MVKMQSRIYHENIEISWRGNYNLSIYCVEGSKNEVIGYERKKKFVQWVTVSGNYRMGLGLMLFANMSEPQNWRISNCGEYRIWIRERIDNKSEI